MMRILKRVLTVWIAVVLLWIAGLTAWRLNTGWRLFFNAPAHGEILGVENGVAIRAYGWGGSIRGKFGLEYECVELANRYYATVLGHKNMTQTGHAESYFWDAVPKGLVAYPNGGSMPPAVNDILVFDGGESDGSVGHVAIVTRVDDDAMTFIQQNMIVYADLVFRRDIWKETLPLTNLNGEWFVGQGRYTLPVARWSRPAPAATPRSSP